MNHKHPHIAVMILNWNGLEDTKECLVSLFENTYPNYSVYLIDNASTKDEVEIIKDFVGTLHATPLQTIIQNKKNLGFAGGNNVGIRKALEDGADYIFLLNNDTVVDPDFLTEAIKPFLTAHCPLPSAHSIGIVSPLMLNYHDRTKVDNTGHDLLTNGDSIPRDRGASRGVACNAPTATTGACGGAALYRASMLKEIGLLDDDFFLNYEDSDLSLRAITLGWNCAFVPTSIVYHKLNASIGKVKNTDYRIRSQRNQLWAYLHSTPWPVILLNLPWILLRDLAVIVISFICLRWTITKIFVMSRWQVLTTLPTILKKRKRVMTRQKISWFTYWMMQKSWIPTYWTYFKQIVIKGKDSVME